MAQSYRKPYCTTQHRSKHRQYQFSGVAKQPVDNEASRWCRKYPRVVSRLKDENKYAMQSGIALSRRDIDEILFQEGITLHFPVNALLDYLQIQCGW